MRGLRSTIALLVVLIGLSVYIYYFSWRQTGTDTGPKQEKVFAGLQTDTIDEITITAESGEKTTIKKTKDAWQIVSPVSDDVDAAEVSGITSNLGTLEVARVIDEHPSDLKEYGLASPRIEVQFKAGGKGSLKLLVGEKSPTGGQLFVKKNDEPRVFLIPAFHETTFNRSTFDLRDKRLLKFERDKVDAVDVTAGGKTLALKKDGSDWKLVTPTAAKADYGTVEGLIGRVQSAHIKSIVTAEAPPADLKKYGLDKPATTVNVVSGSARATLLVGNKTDENAFYARDSSRPMVFVIDGALAQELGKGPDEYRRKDVFEMRAFNVNRVELTRGGQTSIFEMTKGAGDSAPVKWRRVSPNAADVDREKVEEFLTKLSNLRATAFVESTTNTGVDKPVLAVRATFDEKKEDRVNFGQTGNDVFAAHSGEPGVAKVDTTDFTDALKALDEVSK